MRALIQRSKAAHVSIDNEIVGAIDHGLVVLLGLGRDDSLEKGKKLIDMLTSAINGYQNKVLTAAEVIDELIKLAKTIQESDSLATQLNLSAYEYAFYSAVADNDSARELMEKEKLQS